MKTLKALTPSQVDGSTQEVFVALKQKVGMVPNLYAAIGNSATLLKGYLTYAETLKGGVFTDKENETIALAVSQVNDCGYCLAAHSALGKMAGLSENEVLDIRKGIIADEKLNALAALASEITENKGKPSQLAVDRFLTVGYSHEAFAELIGMVSIRIFTNYIFSNGDFEIDFPKVPSLEELATA